MKTYELKFHEAALKEWRRLDHSVQSLFKKQLTKRIQPPHVSSAKLHRELKNTHKIKLRDAGDRLVYEVIDHRVAVFAIGRRDHDTVYQQAAQRLKP